MGLKQDLMQALKEAMQNKDTLKKETITMLRAAILQVEKDGLKELSEAEMGTIVAKEVKKRKESIVDFEKGGRPDIVEQLNKEIEILSVYLPEQLSEAEITKMVVEAIAAVGATGMKDMGKVMGSIREKTAGKADGKLVSDIVKAELGKL
ncbi:MAG: GatB/YqeY domain-containing protein [Clostridia bacterium]|nr:GatB/YqeY domain-containing protein [Clostridia bacterium]